MKRWIWILVVLSFTSAAAYSAPGPDTTPTLPPAAANRCDLNHDGAPDAPDLQFLTQRIFAGSAEAAHDINRDSRVNILDIQVLVNTILGVRVCPD